MSESIASTLSLGASINAELRASFRSRKTRSLRWRLGQLEALARMLTECEEVIIDAVAADLGKPRFEAYGTEVAFLLGEIEHTCKHLRKWSKPTRVRSSAIVQPATSKIVPEPLGVVLVIGTWNYPVQLSLGPIIGAIAAGNCVVIKPSEVAAHTAAVLANLIPKYMDQECVRVMEGAIPETTDLLEQRWDSIFYTGNGMVGRIILAAAAKHLTPVTLELGGKSPAIIDEHVDIKVAARRLMWGKFANAGQTCVAPDYLLVHERVHDELLDQMKATLTEFYGSDAKESPDYGRIINERHFERLIKLLEGENIVQGGDHDVTEKYIEPTLVTNLQPDSPLMQDEIFGPILPIIKVPSVDEAIDFVNDRPKPLALYVFSSDKKTAEKVISHTSFGGGSINHVWLHLAVPGLPFGGVGESGMGSYHGKHGFDLFSHHKSILSKTTLVDPGITYPPYDDFKRKVIKFLM